MLGQVIHQIQSINAGDIPDELKDIYTKFLVDHSYTVITVPNDDSNPFVRWLKVQGCQFPTK